MKRLMVLACMGTMLTSPVKAGYMEVTKQSPVTEAMKDTETVLRQSSSVYCRTFALQQQARLNNLEREGMVKWPFPEKVFKDNATMLSACVSTLVELRATLPDNMTEIADELKVTYEKGSEGCKSAIKMYASFADLFDRSSYTAVTEPMAFAAKQQAITIDTLCK